jgi:hypothetical protein
MVNCLLKPAGAADVKTSDFERCLTENERPHQ